MTRVCAWCQERCRSSVQGGFHQGAIADSAWALGEGVPWRCWWARSLLRWLASHCPSFRPSWTVSVVAVTSVPCVLALAQAGKRIG